MNILGIETSCDETALCVLQISDGQTPKIIAEEISSQIKLHELYGGVVPELASREHLKNLPLMYDSILKSLAGSESEIDCIAVTQGPGLKGCLLMGLCFAKGLSLGKRIPLIGVNHIEGHALAPMLDNPELRFPYIALIVSGGHTELHIVRAVGQYELLARTIDDAAGEAFDKSAHLLGYGYPGGAALAAAADAFGPSSFKLPLVMRESAGFSFSGLKTAISLLVKRNAKEIEKSSSVKDDLASAIQSAIVNALVFKLSQVVDSTGIKEVVITGGVAANRALRLAVSQIPGVRVFVPTNGHCTDNAAMIAYAGGLRYVKNLSTPLNADVKARWPLEECVLT